MSRRPFRRFFVAALTIATVSAIAQADWDQGMKAFKEFSAALALGPDDDLARRIHGRMGNIAACRLELESATSHYRLAGQDNRARKTQTLASQFAGALTQLEKLRATVTEIQGMERQLNDLGDTQGVTTMRESAVAEQSKIDAIEKNLEAVRSALCG